MQLSKDLAGSPNEPCVGGLGAAQGPQWGVWGEAPAVAHGGNPQDPSGSAVVPGGNPQDHTALTALPPQGVEAFTQWLRVGEHFTTDLGLLYHLPPNT